MEFVQTEYSGVFLQPKPEFFIWLEMVLTKQRLSKEQIYFEEQDIACLIPSVTKFKSAELKSFLDTLKLKLLVMALGGFITDRSDFPEISSETFDVFFSLRFRDNVIRVIA
jgi:hypothetical protein